mmetsp:Transcript_22198/g.50078  ORF Transcript_22198/g.50078 Transcript_22198/m.50078 type:complete len:110 (+) Transcript_22198:1010-1339(+)
MVYTPTRRAIRFLESGWVAWLLDVSRRWLDRQVEACREFPTVCYSIQKIYKLFLIDLRCSPCVIHPKSRERINALIHLPVEGQVLRKHGLACAAMNVLLDGVKRSGFVS